MTDCKATTGCDMHTYCVAIKHCRHTGADTENRYAEKEAELTEPSPNCGTRTTVLKDSGERREVGTGAVRDRATGKGRFDLLPLYGLLAGALQMERGAAKYAARNWEQGMPLSWFADAAQRHLMKAIAGFDDEPHWDAAIWNLLCLVEGKRRVSMGLWPVEMDDLPRTYAGCDPGF